MKATNEELSEALGKTTARLAELAFKVQNVLEERNEQLKQHYDLQHPFRQGFLLAMELTTKAIAQTEVNKISSNLPVISSVCVCAYPLIDNTNCYNTNACSSCFLPIKKQTDL